MRIVVLAKNGYYELKRLVHPRAVIPVKFNRHSVDSKIVTNVLAFFMLYMVIFFVSTIHSLLPSTSFLFPPRLYSSLISLYPITTTFPVLSLFSSSCLLAFILCHALYIISVLCACFHLCVCVCVLIFFLLHVLALILFFSSFSFINLFSSFSFFALFCVCVCVCRRGEREKEGKKYKERSRRRNNR